MRIVIVGAGAIGSFLAEKLSAEGQDVVVVESDPDTAAIAQSEIDCLVINGNGASAETLKRAGLEQADLLIAVSSSDAVNVLACAAGTKLGIESKVARVEDPQLKAITTGASYYVQAQNSPPRPGLEHAFLGVFEMKSLDISKPG